MVGEGKFIGEDEFFITYLRDMMVSSVFLTKKYLVLF